MSEYLEIYGANVKLPERPKDEDAINYGLPRHEQKWFRKELPDFFDKVDYDKQGKLIMTEQQEAYASDELLRCRVGIWIWIGEKLRFIPKRYYFYLQYYTLEDGNAPEFREADRLFFLFWEHWFLILWCLGCVRTKKRRAGASSQSCSNILYEAIFYKNSNCGLISKTRDDSKATFTEMVTAAYQLLPPFFKPRLAGKEDSVTELVLVHEKGGVSKITYKAPVLNAFDRGRMSFLLGDEFGKLPRETPAAQLLSIISKTLVKGVKRVGWIDMPSTVNEMTKGGGAEFKRIWDNANQFKRKPTLNRIVRFFQPAFEAYEGYIDAFGDSVIGVPTEEQYEYLVNKWVQYNEEGELISELSEEDIKLGAKHYVLIKRRDGLEGMDLEEETRMNPCTEEEAFLYAGQGCEFNAVNIQKQIQKLEDEPPVFRRMRFSPHKEIVKSIFPTQKDKERTITKPMDDAKGGWNVFELPNKANHFRDRQGYLEPLNDALYSIGVDTTKDNPVASVDGSKPRIIVFKKSCIVDGEETGLYPVAMWDADARLDIHFDEQVLFACKLFGCKVNYEIDARTDYYRYFVKQNAQSFLQWTPKIMLDPVRKNPKIEPGIRSGDIFMLAQQHQIIKSFIDGSESESYNGHVHRIPYISLLKQLLKFDTANRTPFDEVIALIMALIPVFADQQNPVLPMSHKRMVLPQHKLKITA